MATKTIRSKAVALCLLAVVLVAVAFLLDDTVIALVKTKGNAASLAFGRFFSHYGQWNWLMLPCVIAAVIAYLRRDRTCLRIVCIMMISSTLAGIAADVGRALTGRTRPSAPPAIEQGWYGPWSHGQLVGIKPDYNAFPSGHAAASMGLIAPLLFMRRRLGWALLPVPVLISAGRICVGAHHLSDVMAGALVGGAVAGWVVWKIGPVLNKVKWLKG